MAQQICDLSVVTKIMKSSLEWCSHNMTLTQLCVLNGSGEIPLKVDEPEFLSEN